MAISDQITAINNAKQAIKTAIEAKGVSVGTSPLASYASKINAIPAATPYWTRPSDWVALPSLSTTDQRFVGLYAVYPDSNFVGLSASGNYTVNWGDGTVENFASGTKAYHTYSYSNTNLGALTSRGYKQAVISVTPQAGQNLTSLELNVWPNKPGMVFYQSGFLDIAIASPHLTELGISTPISRNLFEVRVLMALLEHVNIVRANLNNCSSLFWKCEGLQSITTLNLGSPTEANAMFDTCTSLQAVPLFDTSNVTSMFGMFSECHKLTSVPALDTSSCVDFNYMFYNCYSLKTIPLIDTSLNENFSGMFEGCESLTSVPFLDTTSALYIETMFYNCKNLKAIPAFNAPDCSYFYSAFTGCSSVDTIPNIIHASDANFEEAFNGCHNMRRFKLTGLHSQDISVVHANLSADALNEIYTNLGAGNGCAIFIDGNHGAATSNTSIATTKGWVVIQ